MNGRPATEKQMAFCAYHLTWGFVNQNPSEFRYINIHLSSRTLPPPRTGGPPPKRSKSADFCPQPSGLSSLGCTTADFDSEQM